MGNSFADQIGIATQVPRPVAIVSNNTNSSDREVRIGNRRYYVRNEGAQRYCEGISSKRIGRTVFVWNIEAFSKKHTVRRMTVEDTDIIYGLCVGNPLYYEYCPPFVTRESIGEDLAALPPNTCKEQKYYVGFFDSEKLLAVMDIIDGYPQRGIAFIGFFMMEESVQGRGTGSEIITEIVDYLEQEGYTAVRLAWVMGNPQAEHFWRKNGFEVIKETSGTDGSRLMLAERKCGQEE